MYNIFSSGNPLIMLLAASIAGKRGIFFPVLGQVPCKESFSPCQCIISLGDVNVNCTGVNMTEVQRVFTEISIITIDFLYLSAFNDQSFPPHLLLRSEVRFLTLKGYEVNDHVRVERDAFDSSMAVAERLTIEYCDLVYLDFAFLTNFSRLNTLKITNSENINNQVINTVPFLPSLSTLSITFCSGFNDWRMFPTLATGVLEIMELQTNRDINDGIMSLILGRILSYSANSLTTLYINENKLTKVPEELHNFGRIQTIDVHENSISNIESISFESSFEFPVIYINISFSNVSEIQPGAFSGFYGQTILNLTWNKLNFLEETAFKSVLEQMFETSLGSINLDKNPFDCGNQPCKWVWLLYGHPNLLKPVLNAKCSNDTNLTDLNAEVILNDCLLWMETSTAKSTSVFESPTAALSTVVSASSTFSSILKPNYTISHQERSSEATSTVAASTQTISINKLVSTDFPTTTAFSSSAIRNIPLFLETQTHFMFIIFWNIF